MLAAPTAASAQTTDNDLLSGYRDWNVVTFGDANLQAESEGAVAVGGTLRFNNTNTATQRDSSGNPGNEGIGILAGKVDLARSNLKLYVPNGSIRLEDPSGVKVLNRDQNNANVNTKVVMPDATYEDNTRPAIIAANSKDDTSKVVSPGLFDRLFNQDAARQLAVTASNDPQSVDAKTDVKDTTTTLTLVKGARNYWRTDGEHLSNVRELKFSGPRPDTADGTFLVVVVDGTQVTFNMTMADAPDPTAILWDMPQVTDITQKGDTINGSILAPDAHLEKTNANIQGTIIVGSANLAGSEQHYFPYDGPTPPDIPVTPVVPDKPTTSLTPDKPSVPATPPVTPSTPTTPGTPAKPVIPVTSTKQADSTTPVRTLATTGSAVTPIAIGALILLLAAIGLITYRRFCTAR